LSLVVLPLFSTAIYASPRDLERAVERPGPAEGPRRRPVEGRFLAGCSRERHSGSQEALHQALGGGVVREVVAVGREKGVEIMTDQQSQAQSAATVAAEVKYRARKIVEDLNELEGRIIQLLQGGLLASPASAPDPGRYQEKNMFYRHSDNGS